MKKSLSELGAVVAREQDRVLAARSERAPIVAAQARLRERARPPQRVRRPLAFAVAATLALFVCVLVMKRRAPASPLVFQVEGARGTTGAFVEAPAERGLALGFSDASAITLDPTSQARVSEIGPDGASVVLERGRAHVSITHREGSRWHVLAGPFDVLVTGTRFDVAWDPARESFDLSMENGTVRVTGGPLVGARSVTTGGRLAVSVPQGLVTEGSSEGPAPPATETPRAAPVPPSSSVRDAGAEKASTPRRGVAPPAWVELAHEGAYARAFEAASNSGFDGECARASDADLVALGDAARYSGHAEQARSAYLLARQRFPGSGAAAEAAFDLGRLAFDREHDYASAGSWFETYGRERPHGDLAREAAGRVIEARQHAGDLDGARTAARAYLAQYPAGPHADLARKLLSP